MNAKNKEYLLDLIDKYQNGTASYIEIAHLSNFYTSHQDSKKWPLSIELKDEIKEKVFDKIQLEIKTSSKKDTKVRPLFNRKIFKYAAAIIIMAAITYFFTKENAIDKEPVVVNNTIEIGADKATLTLEDGTNVALEKGEKFIGSSASSDGEKLIYKTTLKKAESKIAYNYITIPRGGEFYVELADNTRVWLNSDSKLKYPVEFVRGETREVELLYGEAYFDVSPSTEHDGSNFKVLNQGQEIEVLGTEFNVKSYLQDRNIQTTLVEGKLSVGMNNSKHILIPNQQFNYNKDLETIEIKTVDALLETSWKTGYFNFKDKTFYEVSKVLSRWYDVEIIFENEEVANMKISGVSSKNKNLEHFLLTLKYLKNISYEITDSTITIK